MWINIGEGVTWQVFQQMWRVLFLYIFLSDLPRKARTVRLGNKSTLWRVQWQQARTSQLQYGKIDAENCSHYTDEKVKEGEWPLTEQDSNWPAFRKFHQRQSAPASPQKNTGWHSISRYKTREKTEITTESVHKLLLSTPRISLVDPFSYSQ